MRLGLLSNLYPELLRHPPHLPLKCEAGRDSRGEGMGGMLLGSVPSLEGAHGVGTEASSTPAPFSFEHISITMGGREKVFL